MISKLFFCVFVFFICMAVMSCTVSSTNAEGKGIQPRAGTVGPCQDVITENKIANFNQNQTDFQVKAAGYNRKCMTEVKVNGNASQIEVIGHSAIAVLPNLKFTSVAAKSPGVYTFKTAVPQLKPDDYNKILAKLGVPGVAGSYISFEKNAPSYVHFSGSVLYPISNVRESGAELTFDVRGESEALKAHVAKLFSGESPVDLLWSPVADIVSQLTVGPKVNTISWSRSDTISILEALVHDSGGVSGSTFEAIVDYADDWNINQVRMHQRMPELMTFATAQWENPVPTDANSKRLLYCLKYIAYQDSSVPQKSVLEVFEKVSRYHDSTRAALQTAIDYTAGRTYSFEQFEFITQTSSQMHSFFGKNSWAWATAVATRVNFDPAVSTFVGNVAVEMAKRKMSVAPDNLEVLFAKVYGGLTELNTKTYFSLFDFFRSNVKSTPAEAELASDLFVLSGRLNDDNAPYFKELYNWLEDDYTFPFAESTQLISEITSVQTLDKDRTFQFRKMYHWLAVTVALPKSDAVQRIRFYMAGLNISMVTFNALKAEYEILLKQGIPALEAIRLAEQKILVSTF